MRKIKWFSVLVLCVALGLVGMACGESADSLPTITFTPSPTPTPAPEPTASPLTVDSGAVKAALALEGFRAFASEFAAAVAADDKQFFIDRAYFQTPDCPAFGEPAGTPKFCFGMAAPPTGPAIFLGIWNSEGDIVSQEYYETNVRTNLKLQGATLYALGQQKFGLGIGDTEINIVVAYPERTAAPTALPRTISAFRVSQIDGQWRIIGIDSGLADLVPSFFAWYAPWDDAFLAS